MTVDVVGEVVGHQVLARHADIDGVPVLELVAQPVEGLRRDATVRRQWGVLEKYVVPHLQTQLLRSEKVKCETYNKGIQVSPICSIFRQLDESN